MGREYFKDLRNASIAPVATYHREQTGRSRFSSLLVRLDKIRTKNKLGNSLMFVLGDDEDSNCEGDFTGSESSFNFCKIPSIIHFRS